MTATILIVDDEPNVQLVISEFLTLKGYEVRSAETSGHSQNGDSTG